MALTRSMLKGMELSDEQISAIIEEHTSVTNALKEQRDEYKTEADKLHEVSKKLKNVEDEYNQYKKDVEKNDWQKKYEQVNAEFEKFKNDITEQERSSKIKDAYKKLLTECKVGGKHIESILRVTDFSNMKLGEDGTLEDADKLKESVKSEWDGFITSEETHGSDVADPPRGEDRPNSSSRAAQIAAKYHDNLYGKVKEE